MVNGRMYKWIIKPYSREIQKKRRVLNKNTDIFEIEVFS